MIVFVADVEGLEALAHALELHAPSMTGRIRLMEYSQLAQRRCAPCGTYVFLDIRWSALARRRLIDEVAGQIRAEGGVVLGDLSLGDESSSEAPLFERIAGAQLPCAVRRGHAFADSETPEIESREELAEVATQFVLDGFEPHRVTAHTLPSSDSNGARRIYSVLQVGASFIPFVDLGPNSPAFEPSPALASDWIRLGLEGGRVARVDYVVKQEVPTIWRIDDGPTCLMPTLAKQSLTDFRLSFENALQALDSGIDGSMELGLDSARVQTLVTQA